MNKLIAEFLGTFALVFAGCGAICANELSEGKVTHVGISLVFGLVVMALAHALGDISGAHLNPAVTIGFAAARRSGWGPVGPYILVQCLGAIAAAGLLRIIYPTVSTLGQTVPWGVWWQSLALEIVMTWLLMWVILRVSTGAKEKGITAAMAVGGVVGLEALFGGPISGASMNPARSLGPALIGGHLDVVWLYWLAPIAGALLAVVTERLVAPEQAPAEKNAR